MKKTRIICDPQNMTVGEQLTFTEAPELRPTTVVCLKGRRDDPEIVGVLYVGRRMFQGGWRLPGHPLANPFKIGRDGTPDEVVAKYERWLDEQPTLLAHWLPLLRGRRLGCWCADGQPCHARVLAARADATPEVTP